jgi:hypothetical protein
MIIAIKDKIIPFIADAEGLETCWNILNALSN